MSELTLKAMCEHIHLGVEVRHRAARASTCLQPMTRLFTSPQGQTVDGDKPSHVLQHGPRHIRNCRAL